MTQTAFASAGELAQSIRAGRLSSQELTALYLDRIERFNPDLNAVVALAAEAAQARARQADEALAKGEVWGPLHGLPITIKDSFEVPGMPCTSGWPPLKDHYPSRPADAVQALTRAGAIVMGKTNLPLLAGDFQSYNDIYGQTNNPWDRTLSPGGSSGGSAAALAAGLTSLELGSDIGGSLRNPAAFCGVTSHKPSHGLVSSRGQIPPPPGLAPADYPVLTDLAVCGPLARSVADLKLALDLLAAPGGVEARAWRLELPPPRGERLSDFRVGLWLTDPAAPVETAVVDVIQNAADALAGAGVKLADKRPDIDFGRSHRIYHHLLAAVMGLGLPEELFQAWRRAVTGLAEDDHSPMADQMRGATILHRDWHRTHLQRLHLRQAWEDFFKDFDALICPVVPVARLAHDHSEFFKRTIEVDGQTRPYFDLAAWAGLTGVAYLPSTVIPAGFSPQGTPIGLQIVAPYLEDRTALHLAGLAEEVLGGFTPPTDYS